MKILHINTQDRGGAFQAAYRLQQGLEQQEVDVKFLVLYKTQNLPNVYAFLENQSFLNKIKNSLAYRWQYKKQQKLLAHKPHVQYTFPDSAYKIHTHPLVKEADIIHLHWVANFLDYASFFKNIDKPIVWTLHDMNPFSGGFHYESYKHNAYEDLDKKIRSEKQKILEHHKNLHIVTLSKWIYDSSRNSEILGRFPHYLIPNGLPLQIFKAYNKQSARTFLGLPHDKKIILFVADSLEDHRKGFAYLLEALKLLENEEVFLAILGGGKLESIELPFKNLGFVSIPEHIAMAYSAADVFVIPSIEDNLPNTVLESLACGTPVVGFEVGGIPDMVRNGENGFLAELKNSQDLAQKITEILNNDDLRFQMSQHARKIAEKEYALALQAKRYSDLYVSVLTK